MNIALRQELLEQANNQVQSGKVSQVLRREFGNKIGSVLFELVGIGQKYEAELDLEYVDLSDI